MTSLIRCANLRGSSSISILENLQQFGLEDWSLIVVLEACMDGTKKHQTPTPQHYRHAVIHTSKRSHFHRSVRLSHPDLLRLAQGSSTLVSQSSCRRSSTPAPVSDGTPKPSVAEDWPTIPTLCSIRGPRSQMQGRTCT